MRSGCRMTALPHGIGDMRAGRRSANRTVGSRRRARARRGESRGTDAGVVKRQAIGRCAGSGAVLGTTTGGPRCPVMTGLVVSPSDAAAVTATKFDRERVFFPCTPYTGSGTISASTTTRRSPTPAGGPTHWRPCSFWTTSSSGSIARPIRVCGSCTPASTTLPPSSNPRVPSSSSCATPRSAAYRLSPVRGRHRS